MKIFSDYGCKIFERRGKYFIQYDSGQSSGASLLEYEISPEEVNKAKRSEMDAYEVILKAEQRGDSALV